jgi:hypothetical protein
MTRASDADVVMDSVTITGDWQRAAGVHPTALFRLDDHVKEMPLTEPIGGSVAWHDTWVDAKKV